MPSSQKLIKIKSNPLVSMYYVHTYMHACINYVHIAFQKLHTYINECVNFMIFVGKQFSLYLYSRKAAFGGT